MDRLLVAMKDRFRFTFASRGVLIRGLVESGLDALEKEFYAGTFDKTAGVAKKKRPAKRAKP